MDIGREEKSGLGCGWGGRRHGWGRLLEVGFSTGGGPGPEQREHLLHPKKEARVAAETSDRWKTLLRVWWRQREPSWHQEFMISVTSKKKEQVSSVSHSHYFGLF